MDSIYTITSGYLDQERNTWRCFAWFASLEEAEEALNCPEYLHDNQYNVLVIEEVPRGAITSLYREWWYRWGRDRWIATEKPDMVDVVFHFSMG
jgi:hypothetical protein